MEAAIRLSNYSTRLLAREVGRHYAEGENSRKVQRLLLSLPKRKENGKMKRDFRGIDFRPGELNRVLRDLHESEVIDCDGPVGARGTKYWKCKALL
jgi:hypothetical protein